jgi:glycosyltransferase involved in cell wall biosynthesis
VKILHVPYAFLPDPPGGTEIYVDALCRALHADGVDCIVAAPAERSTRYVVDGLDVHRFASAGVAATLETLYGAGDPIASASFARVLDDVRPDVVHQHALSPACSADLVAIARERGVPVVFTYHTPAVSCQRGTLLRMGTEPCDGALDRTRCTACVLDGLGVNGAVRGIAGAVPVGIGRALGRRGLGGGVWTAARMTELMDRRLQAAARLFARVDCVVSLSPWVTRVLRANGVTAERIVSSPHGIATPARSASTVRSTRRCDGVRVKLVHLGRLDPTKGTDLLLHALAASGDAPVSLDVFGVVQDGDAEARSRALRSAGAGDARVTFYAPVANSDVVAMLRTYDAVVVPSQWMETGPLVVLEAFAAGVPVIGSALGGIADKVRHDVDGLLVDPFHSVDAWASALARCVDEPDLLARLRANVAPPRSMCDVACDMRAVYEQLTSRTRAALA